MPQISDHKLKICQLNRHCKRIKIQLAKLQALSVTLDNQTDWLRTFKKCSLRDLWLISKILRRKLQDVQSSQYFYKQERYCYLAKIQPNQLKWYFVMRDEAWFKQKVCYTFLWSLWQTGCWILNIHYCSYRPGWPKGLLDIIWDHPVFHNNFNVLQADPGQQLLVTLRRLGTDGNRTSVKSLAEMFKVSGKLQLIWSSPQTLYCHISKTNLTEGTIKNWTNGCIKAISKTLDHLIAWSNANKH